MHRRLFVYTWLSGCGGRDGTRPSQNAPLAQYLRSREGRTPLRPGFATAPNINCRADFCIGGNGGICEQLNNRNCAYKCASYC